ncbi:MAG: hypothetical protein ABH873_01895 [Candidatus Firestonebacteria bacterium]
MNDKKVIREKILISIAISLILIFGIYSLVLEPAVNCFSSARIEKNQIKKMLIDLKKEYKDGKLDVVSKDKVVIFGFNYLGEVTEKSKIKLKGSQVVDTQRVKGVSSFQMKFTSNANTLTKFLHFSENTVPPLIISNFRISSISGGSFEGMRQLECSAMVSVIPRNLSKKIVYPNLEKYMSLTRDPFSPFVKSEVKKVETPVTEEAPPPPPASWILNAAMSDDEGDYLIFTNNDNNEYIVNLKKGKDANAGFKINNDADEAVKITIGHENIEWTLGETKSQEILPKELIDIINKSESGKETILPQESQEENKEEAVDDAIKLIPQFDKLPDNIKKQIKNRRRK